MYDSHEHLNSLFPNVSLASNCKLKNIIAVKWVKNLPLQSEFFNPLENC